MQTKWYFNQKKRKKIAEKSKKTVQNLIQNTQTIRLINFQKLVKNRLNKRYEPIAQPGPEHRSYMIATRKDCISHRKTEKKSEKI